MKRDIEQLRLLSIFHYVMGGLAIPCSFIPLLDIWMRFSMVGSAWELQPIDWVTMIIPAAFLLVAILFAGTFFVAGYFLSRHRNRFFCLVVAGIDTLFVPLGTILGIFTIVILMRNSVIALFEENRSKWNYA